MTDPGTAGVHAPAPPWVVPVSKHVSVRYGYQDAHVEVGIKVAGLTKWISFQGDELVLAEHAFSEAKKWRELPEDVRRQSGAKS